MDLVLIAGAAAAVLMLFLMQAMTTFTYDDYYYSLFLRDGLGGFVEQNILHYQLRNGRVLVHLAAELLLAGGSWFYSLANLLILMGVLLLGVRYIRGSEPAEASDPVLGPASAAALILTCHYRVFRSWLLCPADSMNYMLPLLAIFGMLLALRRGRKLPAILLALLSGATTELYCAMCLVIAALEALADRLRRGKWDLLRLVCLGCSLCGMATILLSPATRQRVSSEFSLGGIAFSFLRYANSIAAPGTSIPLLTAASLLLGTAFPDKSRLRRVSIPTALVLLSGYVLPRSTALTAAVFFLFCGYALVCACTMILRGTDPCCGFALLGGLSSTAVMIFSSSGSVRGTVPLVLMLLLCCIHLLSRLAVRSGSHRRIIRPLVALVLTLCLVLHVPTLQGVAGNWRIMQENEASMDAQAIRYTDYDPRYCGQQLFMSRDFQRVYLKYLELEGAQVLYNYTYGPEITIGGAACTTVEYRGQTYLPLRAAVEAEGGSIQLISDGFLEIRLDGRTWLYQSPTLHTPSGAVDAAWDIISLENQNYITSSLLADAFDITFGGTEDAL